MLVYYFVAFIVSNRYLLFWVSNGHNSITVQNRAHVYMNFFDHEDLGNHLLQLCPKVVKHPVCIILVLVSIVCDNMLKDLERESNLLLTRKQLPMEQDVFGAESRREILEPYNEKKEAEWRGNSSNYIFNSLNISGSTLNTPMSMQHLLGKPWIYFHI